MSGNDFEDDRAFDVGRAGSTGPDIYGDNLDFDIEDNLPDFLPSPTSSNTFPTSAVTSQNAYSSHRSYAQHSYGDAHQEQQRDHQQQHHNHHHHLQRHQQQLQQLQAQAGQQPTAHQTSRGIGGGTYHMVHALPPKPEFVTKSEPAEHSASSPALEPPPRSTLRDSKQEDAGKIFVGGLNWETTDETMRNHFSKWGRVLECSVMKEPGTQKSRGFGFLTYANQNVVPAMLAAEHILDGKRVDPKRAIPREEQVLTEKIFVGGISPEVSEEDLTAFFNQFGKVIDTTLMIDRDTGRPRGFGFVTFESDVMVEELVARHDLAIKGKTVEVRRAMPKHKALQVKQAREVANATFGGSSVIPTFVSDSRTSTMGKLGVANSVQGRPEYAANSAVAAAAAAAALYGGAPGPMGMNGAAKNWMAQMYGAANAAAAAGAAGSPAPSAVGAGAFYGFPGAAAFQGMYNPAALMAYYQRMATSGFNWQAAAAAAAAARPGSWFPGGPPTSVAGSTGTTVGGYDMYAGGGPSAGGGAAQTGGYGNMAAMMMAASRGMAAGGHVATGGTGSTPRSGRSLERDSGSRELHHRSSRSRSPQRWDNGGRGRSASNSGY